MKSVSRLVAEFCRARKDSEGIHVRNEWMSDESRVRHTHIVGATGSGKTVLLEKMIFEDIRRGIGAVIFDAKGDRDFYLRLKSYCKEVGRASDLFLLSSNFKTESVIWNPCALGSPSELQTKFYNSSVYDNAFYAKAVENGLLKAFQAIDSQNGDRAFCLSEVVAELKRSAKVTKNENLEGLYLDLENLNLSEWADLLGAKPKLENTRVALIDIIQQGKILFVDLPTEAKAIQSSRIGRLILQEVILISGMRKLNSSLNSKKKFAIYVDEFDAFATPSFGTFLNKGRSSGFMITIGHQTLSQLERVGLGFQGEVLGNTNVRFIFRQDDPKDAETWAKFIGTKASSAKTYRTTSGMKTGEASVRETEEYIVHPNEIKRLKVGHCIMFMKSPYKVTRLKVPFEKARALEKPKDQVPFRLRRLPYLSIDDDNARLIGSLGSIRP